MSTETNPTPQENENSEEFDFLDLPDDEFVKHSPPDAGQMPTERPPNEFHDPEPEPQPEPELAPVATDEEEEEEKEQSDPEDQEEEQDPDPEGDPDVPDNEGEPEGDPTPEREEPADSEKDPEGKQEEEQKVDYEAFYNKLVGSPIKANGKEITLQNEEEALQLIQMGANYTKKMQVLQPALRIVKMLENNKLLDENKLSQLIDLDKGNPQAIQNFLKSKDFDPHTVDEEEADRYTPGDHRVSDADWKFSQALDQLEMTEHGQQLMGDIHQQWDTESKQAVYREPEVLQVLAQHKSNGIYETITNEMERQRTLGKLGGIPFLQAYKAVGDFLQDQNLLAPKEASNPSNMDLAPPAQQPVARRTAVPKKAVRADDRARAARPTRATPSTPKGPVNYLDIPDDEFLKTFEGRL